MNEPSRLMATDVRVEQKIVGFMLDDTERKMTVYVPVEAVERLHQIIEQVNNDNQNK